MKYSWLLVAPLLLTGCQQSRADNEVSAEGRPTVVTASTPISADAPPTPGDDSSLKFKDVTMPPAQDQARFGIMQIQVILDRLRFSPGVIDGKSGQSYMLALRGFQSANRLDPTGVIDGPTGVALRAYQNVAATRMVQIPLAFARGPFVPDLPKTAADQAKLPALGYRNMLEALAERFHTTPATLVALNGPQAQFFAHDIIKVPNIAEADAAGLTDTARDWGRTLQMLAIAPVQPTAAKIIVDESAGSLSAFDAAGQLIAQFPATMGSAHDPLPLGRWHIQGVSRNPDFRYSPKLFWDVSDSKESVLLKPGPNSPVGVAWISLSKPHYGIHGTSEPQTIGRAESHGCVRLTNWDAARLAMMIKSSMPVVFQE